MGPVGWMAVVSLLASSPLFAAEHTFTVSDTALSTAPAVSSLLYGMNVARWDRQLYPTTGTESLANYDKDAVSKLKTLMPGFLKYPGGNDADSYLWNSPENDPDDMDTNEFLHMAAQCKSTGFITVNFSKPPELAASWLQYIKSASGTTAVPYWEVGDEIWGSWSKSHVPGEEYGRRFRAFSQALKAVDPNVKCAANLSLGNPDTAWTREALSTLGDSFDMVTMTYFPQNSGKESDAALFKSPNQFRRNFRKLDAYVAQQLPNRPRPLYCLVGFNSVDTHPGPQTVQMSNAIFMAQMFGAMAEVGCQMSCWWAYHNEWKPRGGDYGVVTSTPQNTPYFTWYVMRALSQNFKGTLLAAEQTNDLEFYAMKQDSGQLTLVLINKSGTASQRILVQAQSGTSTWAPLLDGGTSELITSATMASSSTVPPAEYVGRPVSPDEPIPSVPRLANYRNIPPYSVTISVLAVKK